MLFKIPRFASLKSGGGQQNVSWYLCYEPPVYESSYLVRNIYIYFKSGLRNLRFFWQWCQTVERREVGVFGLLWTAYHHVACFHHLWLLSSFITINTLFSVGKDAVCTDRFVTTNSQERFTQAYQLLNKWYCKKDTDLFSTYHCDTCEKGDTHSANHNIRTGLLISFFKRTTSFGRKVPSSVIKNKNISSCLCVNKKIVLWTIFHSLQVAKFPV